MLEEGNTAPAFTAPLATGDIETFSLADAVETNSPVVLAFFPGAFTGVCSHEMRALQDRLEELSDAGATLYGISVDLPFALNEFRDRLSLSFDLVSDTDREAIDAFDIAMDFEAIGVHDIAERAVLVVDGNRTVTYAWVSDDPGVEPDYDELLRAVDETA